MKPQNPVTGRQITTDDNSKEQAWAAAKKASFAACQILHPHMQWKLAFNVVMAIIEDEHKDTGAGPGDVQLWCKEACELFEEGFRS